MRKDFQAPLIYRKWFIEAEFMDVVAVQRLVPDRLAFGPQNQLLGKWHSADMVNVIPATTKIIQASGVSLEDILVFQERVFECATRRTMRVLIVQPL